MLTLRAKRQRFLLARSEEPAFRYSTMVYAMTSPGTHGLIAKRVSELRASGELGLVAYITAGDPTLDATLKFVLAVAKAGADVIELGVPFSDPLADGPTI